MKKLFYFAALLLTFVACDEEKDSIKGVEPVEFPNLTLCIHVEDSETGEDLLNPENPLNLLSNPIKGYFERSSFGCYINDNLDQFTSPQHSLFYLQKSACEKGMERYALRFGNFQPALQHEEKEFLIEWGDGTTSQILFSYYQKDEFTTARTLKLDGVACEVNDDWCVTIKKEVKREQTPEEQLSELLKRATQQMNDYLAAYNDFDPAQVVDCLVGRQWLIHAKAEYTEDWHSVESAYILFGEFFSASSKDRYTFSADGTFSCDTTSYDLEDRSYTGTWSFDPEDCELVIRCDIRSLTCRIIALGEDTFAWEYVETMLDGLSPDTYISYHMREVYTVM